MNTWFRMYNEVHSDPKVQTLPPILFRAWVNLMCLANMNGDVLPPLKEVAYRLHLSEAKAHEFILSLIDKNLFEEREDGNIQPHNWNGRQFKSDVSTERVKQFRERRRNVSVTPSATLPDTDTEQRQIQNQEGSLLQNSSKLQVGSPIHVLSTPKNGPSTAFDPMPEFQLRWNRYPNKDGRKDAERHWKATIRTPADLVKIDRALDNYIEHLRVTGYAPKNGKTFFNNWLDWVEWVEPVRSKVNSNGHEQRNIETKGEQLIRKQKESGERVRELLRGSTGNGTGPDDPARTDGPVHPRLIGSD